MKRWSVVLLAILVLSVFSGGVLFAQTLLKSVPVSVTIVSGVPMVEFYSDAELTTPITGFDFDEMGPGESTVIYFYLANTGGQNLNLAFDSSVSGWGELTTGPESPFEIWIGRSASCWVRLEILPGAAPGIQNAELYLYEVSS